MKQVVQLGHQLPLTQIDRLVAIALGRNLRLDRKSRFFGGRDRDGLDRSCHWAATAAPLQPAPSRKDREDDAVAAAVSD